MHGLQNNSSLKNLFKNLMEYDIDYGMISDDVAGNILLHLNDTELLDGVEMRDMLLRVRSRPELGIFITVYALITVISLFGNALVCRVVWKQKHIHNVTYVFIANLAMSDILITLINIPFNIARNVLEEWPFGAFLCHYVNFNLVTSVYVSTFTMLCICLDRYKIILNPLQERMTRKGAFIAIFCIWICSIFFSLPYAVFSKEIQMFIYKPVLRCQLDLPSYELKKYLILVTTLTQYVIPLTITAAAYIRIAAYLWSSTCPGDRTAEQYDSHIKSRRRTIKMLAIVVSVFAVSWFPLNTYHIISVFYPNKESAFSHNGTTFFAFHLLAMSSVCYNPFIYCWLNDVFRSEARYVFRCCYHMSSKVHPGIEMDGVLVRADAASKIRNEKTKRQSSRVTQTSTSSGKRKHLSSQSSTSSNSCQRTCNSKNCLMRQVTDCSNNVDAERIMLMFQISNRDTEQKEQNQLQVVYYKKKGETLDSPQNLKTRNAFPIETTVFGDEELPDYEEDMTEIEVSRKVSEEYSG